MSARDLWYHDDFLFEIHMQELTTMDAKTAMKLAKRIARHEAPGIHPTTDSASETVKQMSPVEKMKLRRRLRTDVLLQKSAKRLMASDDVLRDMNCSPTIN